MRCDQAGVDGLALLQRQMLLGNPGEGRDAEQVAAGRALEPPHEVRVHLVLGARACGDDLAPTARGGGAWADAFIGHRALVQ